MSQDQEAYFDLISRQNLLVDDLDYDWFETQIPFVESLSKIDDSAISIFDMHQMTHIFACENFNHLFNIPAEQARSSKSIAEMIHPEDRSMIARIGFEMIQFCFALPSTEKNNYKLINEFRLQIAPEKYVRVIEQHKIFKADSKGNIWLTLSMVDLSPNQDPDLKVLNQVVNTKTGERYSIITEEETPLLPLTKRENQVLNLVSKGLLSKEISDLLNISTHTVNTHRQRILQKMNVSNSVEAIEAARRFGLN